MRLSLGTARNLAAGIVFALGLAYAATPLYAACSASFMCTEGELMGIPIECVCEGSGTCLEHNGDLTCACDGFPTTNCDCDNGCTE
jgi:hypothetical protein